MRNLQASGSCWDRLHQVLIGIKPGDIVSVDALVDDTGLLRETARTVLEALTRAELFERTGRDRFLRRSLFDDRAVRPPESGRDIGRQSA